MIEHIIPALLIELAICLLLRSLAAGAAAASVWSISREIAQAEYRWIEQFGGGHRVNMPWWGGLDFRVWLKADPWLDWIVPSLLAIAIAVALKRASKKSRRAP
jgi:hypothetical protein